MGPVLVRRWVQPAKLMEAEEEVWSFTVKRGEGEDKEGG